MRSVYLALCSLLAVPTALWAQSSHQEAKNLLAQSSATMKGYATLKIDFDYNFANNRVDPPITQSQSGTIAIKSDDYHLKLESLEQLRVGNKLYNILHADEEVQVTQYDPAEDQGLTPSKILDLFSEGYSYKLGGSEVIDGQKIRYVILKPNANEEIDKIMIGIEAQSKHIYSMKQWGTNGTVTTLSVKNFSPNPALPASHFKFNKANYPGYYIAQ